MQGASKSNPVKNPYHSHSKAPPVSRSFAAFPPFFAFALSSPGSTASPSFV